MRPDQDDRSPKKNVLISKKPSFHPIEGYIPSVMVSSLPLSPNINDPEHILMHTVEDVLLEHIIEETCESVDSLGLGLNGLEA